MSTALAPRSIFDDTERALRTILAVEDNYTTHIRDFCRWVTDTGHGVDFESIGDYFKYLNDSDYAAATVKVKRQAVIKRIRDLAPTLSLDERAKIDVLLKDLNKGETAAPKEVAGVGMEKS